MLVVFIGQAPLKVQRGVNIFMFLILLSYLPDILILINPELLNDYIVIYDNRLSPTRVSNTMNVNRSHTTKEQIMPLTTVPCIIQCNKNL